MNDSDSSPDADTSLDLAHTLDAEVTAHKVDTLVRAANIQVMRGNLADAVSACQEALALQPGHPDVRELLADILVRQGKRHAAIAEYRAVFEAHPDRVSAERKIAQLSLVVGEQQRLLERQRELVEDPSRREHVRDRTHIALISSILLPGLGQFCLGAYVMGAALVVGTVALAYYVLRKLLLEPLSVGAGPGATLADAVRQLPTYVAAYSPWTKVLILGAFLLILGAYAYGIIDTLRISRAQQGRRDKELGIA